MKPVSKSKTILMWTKNPPISKFTLEIAKELKLNVHNIKTETDLLAIPCFLIIVDTEKLKTELLSDFNQIAKHMNPNECSIIVFGKRIINAPFYVKPLLTYANKAITKEYLEKLIKKAMTFPKKIKQDMFKQRINRIIYLYKLLDEGKVIETKDICFYFEISDRTLRRDVKVLRDVCDKEIMFNKDSGYYFN
jgi:hypothetical protein